MRINSRVYVHTTDKEDNFIFNGLTGSLDLANKKIAGILKDRNIDKVCQLKDEEFSQLKESGYIIDETESKLEEDIFKNYVESMGDKLNINTFVISPTLQCNLGCKYCFENIIGDRNITMNEDMLNKMLDFITNRVNNNNNKSYIELFGGEPLMESTYPYVEKIFQYARTQNIPLNITTNGTNIENYYTLLKEYSKEIKKIQITLDGCKEEHDKRRHFKNGHGTYEIIFRNALKILELGIAVDFRINVDKNNINGMQELISYINSSELIFFNNFNYYFAQITDHLNPSNPNLLDEAELAIELDKLNLIDKGNFSTLGYIIDSTMIKGRNRLPSFTRCEANSENTYVIAPNGNVYNCCEVMGNDSYITWTYYPQENKNSGEKEFSYNNILRAPLRKECKDCTIALLCGGGCMISRNNRKVYCDIQEKVVDKFFNYLRMKYNLS